MDHMGPGPDATFEQRLEAWALTDLEFHWGEAYAISHDGGWRARRRDGLGEITAADPDELDGKIRADYSQRPVPRDAGDPR